MNESIIRRHKNTNNGLNTKLIKEKRLIWERWDFWGRFERGVGIGVFYVMGTRSSRSGGALSHWMISRMWQNVRVVLIWRSSARYWRRGYADITGMRLDAVKEDTKLTGVREDDAEDERIGWRLMIGRGGRLWGKQPKGSTRRVNPSNRQKLLACTATRHQGAIEILWALYSEISLVGCPSFICSSVQDRLFIILKWLRGVGTL